jgi:hypothetical protein
MTTILKSVFGAIAASAILGAPHVAQAQSEELRDSQYMLITQTRNDALQARRDKNCVRFGILKSRLREYQRNPNHPFWKGTKAQDRGGVPLSLDEAIAFLDSMGCPPSSAAAPPAQISLGGGVNWTRMPQVSGGTRIVAPGNEVAVVNSARVLTGESASFAARGALPNTDWLGYNIETYYDRFNRIVRGGVATGTDGVALTYADRASNGSTGVGLGATGMEGSINSRGSSFGMTFGLERPLSGYSGPSLAATSTSPRASFGVGIRTSYSTLQHDFTMQSNTFAGINQTTALDINSLFIAMNIMTRFFYMANPDARTGFFVGGSFFVAPGISIINADLSQQNRCNLCPAAEQAHDVSRSFDRNSFAVMAGADAQVGWKVTSNSKVQVEGSVQHLNRTPTIRSPITPAQAPATLGYQSSTRASIGVRAVLHTGP